MGIGKIAGKTLSGDVADAGPWPAGPTVPSAQSGGQPTGWVFSLPPLPISANLPSLHHLKLSSLSNLVEGKEKKRKQRRKKKRRRKRRRKKKMGLGLVRVIERREK
jgi:hypothetical protein